MNGPAFITFDFRGQRFEYAGGLPLEVSEAVAHLFDSQGFWIGGYPPALLVSGKEEGDDLPTALWEIEHIGGRVVEIHGRRPSGAILAEDWKHPRIY